MATALILAALCCRSWPQGPKEPTRIAPSRIDLRGAVTEVAFGGGWRYLVLKTNEELVILDLESARLATALPLPDPEAVVAAGRNELLAIEPRTGIVHRWELGTFFEKAPGKLEIPGIVERAAMGSDDDRHLFVVWVEGREHLERTFCALYDAETLRDVSFEGLRGGWHSGHEQAHVRASADGEVFGIWSEFKKRIGTMAFVNLRGEPQKRRLHTGVPTFVIPSADGKVISSYALLSPEGELLRPQDVQFRIPSTDPEYFTLFFHNNTQLGRLRMKARLSVTRPSVRHWFRSLAVPEMAEVRYWEDGMMIADRLLLVPQADLLVTIPPPGDRLYLRKLEGLLND